MPFANFESLASMLGRIKDEDMIKKNVSEIEIRIINSLLENSDIKRLEEFCCGTDNLFSLHYIAMKFNWDDGFQIPQAIIDNPICDLGTALMIFYLAEGELIFEEINEESIIAVGESKYVWNQFLRGLFEKISTNWYKNTSISYRPVLTTVQLYKLRKANPSLSDVFLKPTPGDEWKIE